MHALGTDDKGVHAPGTDDKGVHAPGTDDKSVDPAAGEPAGALSVAA